MNRRVMAWSGAALSALTLVGCTSTTDAAPTENADKQVQVRAVSDLLPDSTVTISGSGDIVFASPGLDTVGALPQARCPGRDPVDPEFEDGTIVWTRTAGGAEVPLSSTDGPENGSAVDGGFTPTPRGAVLAGLHLINTAARGAEAAWMVVGERSVPIPDRQLAGFEGRQALLESAEQNARAPRGDDGLEDPVSAPSWAAPLTDIEAYRVSAWTPDNPTSAIVDYAVPGNDGAFTTRRYVLHWAGHWALEVDASGPVTATSTTKDLTGWTNFPAAGDTVCLCATPPA